MRVKGCDHIGIQVRDVERSARFYEEHLGFERVERWSLAHPYVQRVVGYFPDVTLTSKGVEFVSGVETPTWGPNKGGRLVYMKDPDGIRVELVETARKSDGTPL
jgi:catechol 2,3-dioxygenase-like lactoylglutathione lyase family enzyme